MSQLKRKTRKRKAHKRNPHSKSLAAKQFHQRVMPNKKKNLPPLTSS